MRPPSDSRPSGASDLDAIDAAGLDSRIDRAEIALLFERTRTSNWIAFPVGLLLCWLLWNVVPQATLLGWLALKYLVAFVRLGIAWRYRRDGPAHEARWGRRYEWALVVDGTVYGLIATLLLPPGDPEAAALLNATVIGVAAIGLIVLSVRPFACLGVLRAGAAAADPLPAVDGNAAVALYGTGDDGLPRPHRQRRAACGGDHAHHAAAALRDGHRRRPASAGARPGGAAQRGEGPVPRHHEPRDAHAAARHARAGASLARAGSPEADRYLGMLEHTGRHLLGLINDVLDYSKIESGHLQLAPRPFRPGRTRRGGGRAHARVGAREGPGSSRSTLALPRPFWVTGDAVRLRQVLLNLTGNAVKFTDAGRIELRAALRCRRPRRCSTVDDSGEGVPLSERERIFEPFHQGDASFGRRHGGTGLGLAISRELARAMGGDVSCADATPAAGACFELRAAAAAWPRPPNRRRDPELSSTLQGEVLLVEDNPVNALVAQAMLERVGLHVEWSTTASRPSQRVRERRYDLVLMDCQMPGMDGFEATRRIRAEERAERREPLRIVALTANALEGDRQRSLDAGMDDHLAKPFGEAELAVVLRATWAVRSRHRITPR